jgi:hypothetical protein
MPDRVPHEMKHQVAERALYRCEYCGTPEQFSSDSLSVEHIVPRGRGGSGDPSNLALSCQGCNNHKYLSIEAVDPVTGDLVPLFHPRQHTWSEHFAWNEDFTLMLGITPTGRATADKLRLNRLGIRNMRQVLRTIGRIRLPDSQRLEAPTTNGSVPRIQPFSPRVGYPKGPQQSNSLAITHARPSDEPLPSRPRCPVALLVGTFPRTTAGQGLARPRLCR